MHKQIPNLLNIIATQCAVPVDEIIGPGRRSGVVRARAIYVGILREGGYCYAELAQLLNRTYMGVKHLYSLHLFRHEHNRAYRHDYEVVDFNYKRAVAYYENQKI